MTLFATVHSTENGFPPWSAAKQQIVNGCSHVWKAISAIPSQFALTLQKIRDVVVYILSDYARLAEPPPPIGGVANAGNSCYISLVLQQFAAEPEFFTLQNGDPTNSLNKSMTTCVSAIQQGRKVSKNEMQDLVRALSENGWQEKPGDQGDPLELLAFVSTIMKVNQMTYDHFLANPTPEPIVYVTDGRSKDIETLHYPLNAKVLWIINASTTELPRETIATKTHTLALKEIHMTLPLFFGINHIYCLRKAGDQWFKCSDANVTAVALKNMPISHIRRLVYLATKTGSEDGLRSLPNW